MKYQRFAALVLAAALLLAGCGGTQSSPSAAADQSSDSSRSTPGAVAQAAQTDRITDQYTLEKNVSGVWGEEAVQCISDVLIGLQMGFLSGTDAQKLYLLEEHIRPAMLTGAPQDRDIKRAEMLREAARSIQFA